VSDDTNVNVSVTASTSNLEQGMQQGVQAVQSGADGMRNGLGSIGTNVSNLTGVFSSFLSNIKNSMSGASTSTGSSTTAIAGHFTNLTGSVSGAVSGLQSQMGGLSTAVGFISSKFAALAALAAGVGVFKEGINATKEFTGEAMGLSKALGVSATDAATFNVALGDIGSSAESVTEGANALARQIRTNEEAINNMGLKTRDANGEYRNMKDLLLDAVKVMGSYKEGQDRIAAGQVLFRGAAADVGSLLKLNNQILDDAKQKQEDLGLTVTQEGVQAMKDYKASMNDVGDVMQALKKTIGDAVMPIFTQFGQWLSSVGPAAVTTLKVVVDSLATVFWGVRMAVIALWDVITAGLYTLTEPVRAFGAAFYKAMTGDFAGAKAEIANIGRNIASAWSESMKDIVTTSEKTAKQVSNLWGDGTPTKPTDNSKKKSFKDPTPAAKPKDDRMKQWEADLLAEKTHYMQTHDMQEMSLADETAYWKKILDSLKDGDTQKAAVRKQYAAAELAQQKQEAANRKALAQEEIDFNQKVDLASLDAEQQADAQRIAMGQETDAQALQMQQEFENKRFAIEQKALQDRLALLPDDPNNVVERKKILDQILELEQTHANAVTKIQDQATQQATKPYLDLSTSIGQSFKSSLSGMLQGTTTFAGAMKSLFTGIGGAFADMVADMAAKWLMTQITNRIVQTGTAVAQVMSNAAVAGSAAFASTAAIPLIGPELAPGAAAAAYAATSAFAPMASARNGFDIPSGLNPITQLHEREMVLPAKQADAVRDMAERQGRRRG
jgi:hypothetical protein